MATTLVGVFNSVSDAERAREQLLTQGIARSAIHITNNESLMSRSTSTTSDSDREHRGFFARLFGLGEDHEHVDQYSQAVKSGSALLTVTLDDASQASRVESLLTQAGAIDVDERSRTSSAAPSASTGAILKSGTKGDTLKVVQEELQVGKRQVETGGVRVRQYVTERPVKEQIQLCEERAIVERRPVDRPATQADLQGLGNREIEVRERAEQPVVAKQARVVEEVRVGKEATQRTETVQDTVRRTDVDVEQLTAQEAARQKNTPSNQPRR